MVIRSAQNLSVEAAEDEKVVSLDDFFRVVRNSIWTIVLTISVAVGIAIALSSLQTPQYEASIRILIRQESGIVDSPMNVGGLRDLTATMAKAVATRPVAEETISRLDLNVTPEQLLKGLWAYQEAGTQFVQVSYRDPDPERARLVVTTVGEVFSEQMERMSKDSPSASPVIATLWERAAVPVEPVSPNPLRNAAVALMVGTVLGIGLAFLRDYFDDSWRSTEEAEQVTGTPVFGVIPQDIIPRSKGRRRKNKVSKKAADDRVRGPDASSSPQRIVSSKSEGSLDDISGYLITLSEPDSPTAEAFRALSVNLLYALADMPSKVVVLTSPDAREGKSLTCSNLGVVLAQMDKRTLIVDCDFRGPVQHELLSLRNSHGLANVLVGEHEPPEVWQKSPAAGLWATTAGHLPPNPVRLLGSRRFAGFLIRARQEFDYVLIDAPPTQPVSDSMLLAPQGDGVLLVFDSQSTRKRIVRESVRSLQAVKANVVGTVITNFGDADNSDYLYDHIRREPRSLAAVETTLPTGEEVVVEERLSRRERRARKQRRAG
jgi:capsular exopolysaccharide synthesis family protein